jgi:hypothetical protein
MSSLADLYSFQALLQMHSNATMQQYAVLRPAGDGISVDVVHFGHHKWVVNTGCGSLLPFRVGRECVWAV